ncbi:hypothetical protein BH11PSE3_BH11PSE3_41430 [soil metagenome]
MRDQTDNGLRETTSHGNTRRPQERAPPAAPELQDAAWHSRPARPTFVQVRAPIRARHAARRIGFASLAVLGIVGWAAMQFFVADRLPGASGINRRVSALDIYPESGTPVAQAAALVASGLPTSRDEALPEAGPPNDDAKAQDTTVRQADAASPPEGSIATVAGDPDPAGPDPAGPEPAGPEPAGAAAAEDGNMELAAPAAVETLVRLEKGDTFGSVLQELGLAKPDVVGAIAALASHVSLNRLSIGQALTVKMQRSDGAQAQPVLQALTIRPEPRREITLERDGGGNYPVEEEVFEVARRLQRASGTIEGSVIASAVAAGVPQPALAEMLRAFSWDVNFQHDIKVGDRFDVLVEQSWTSDGQPVDAGRVLWAALTTGAGARRFSVYRFKPRDAAEFFYNKDGESVVKALLRTPLNMSRISSRFGLRHHPVLKFTRLHAGIDFAAPPGTPILAAGAGRVIEAGLNGGYGRWVKIGHDGGLATGYAHMSRIASGIRRSARVRQGQVIGFVGSSGLSTGPHLHFELHRQGRPIDPLSMARTAMRSRLAGQDLARFKGRVAEIDRTLKTVAVADGP